MRQHPIQPPQPIVGVLAVLWRDDNVLLVRRARPPQAGQWGFPGGRLEFGETVTDGARRELREETGVEGEPQEIVTAVDLIDAEERDARFHYVLVAVLFDWKSGEPTACDDALEARWFSAHALPDALCPDVDRVVQQSRRRPRGVRL